MQKITGILVDKEFYNISAAGNGLKKTTKVLVHKSIQHSWNERELTVSKETLRRLAKLAGDGVWHCESPTPYRPRCIFVVKD